MDDFLELGLEVCDKAIDIGFDKLPDRIVSPLGADIPHPHLFHRNKKGQLVNQKGEVQKDTAKNREREHKSSDSGSKRDKDRGVGEKPARSATMPVDYYARPSRRREDDIQEESNRGNTGYSHSRSIDRRPSQRARDLDVYAPNPTYSSAVATRPPITSRRSQSYQPRSRRAQSPSPSSGSTTPDQPSDSKAARVFSNPYAAGALGALTGGLLANQAGKASGLDTRRRSKSQSSTGRGRGGKGKLPGEGDEALVTLAGMLLGGVTAAFGSDKYKKFRDHKAEERRLFEEGRERHPEGWGGANAGRVAREDFDREGHEMERGDLTATQPAAWAKSQADVYPAQIREAKRWQAQVEAGERERERLQRDDVVMVEDLRRERERPRQQKVYREERIYQPQPEYVTRRVVERIEDPVRYERRSRRRSFDDSRYDRRREVDRDRDSGYGVESRPRERYVVSGGR